MSSNAQGHAPHPLTATCWTCQTATGSPQIDLDRRVTWRAPANAAAGTPKMLHIVSSARMLAFCGQACWSVSAAAVAAELDLRSTYPHGQAAPCSRCGAAIDRTEPHVRFTLSQMSYAADQPGLARCIDDVTWAILCHPACAKPGAEDEEAAQIAALRRDPVVA